MTPSSPAAVRSLHVIPGSNERFLKKAPSIGADALMFDLEDGVAKGEKEQARVRIATALADPALSSVRKIVRVNATDTPWMRLDLEYILAHAPSVLDAIALPKVVDARDVFGVDEQLRTLELRAGLEPGQIGIDIIIETARGLRHIDEILESSTRVTSVFFGPLDFAASLGMPSAAEGTATTRQLDALMSCRLAVLVAGRAAGVSVLDGPYFLLSDDDGLRREAQEVKELGFDGKLTIHPAQIPIVNDVFTPSRAEFEHACAILDACKRAERDGLGAIRFEDAMIDEATRKLAESTVRRGERNGLQRPSSR